MNDCTGVELSFECRMICNIENALEALLIKGASSYSIGSRSFTSLDINTLYDMRRKLIDDRDGSMYTNYAKFGRG